MIKNTASGWSHACKVKGRGPLMSIPTAPWQCAAKPEWIAVLTRSLQWPSQGQAVEIVGAEARSTEFNPITLFWHSDADEPLRAGSLKRMVDCINRCPAREIFGFFNNEFEREATANAWSQTYAT